MRYKLGLVLSLFLLKIETASGVCDCTSTDCTNSCVAGTYHDGTNNGCSACPSGYYCPGGTGGPLTPCAAGTYSSGTSQSSSSSCTACAANEFSVAGSSACILCPAGYSCASSSSTPVACSGTTYSLAGETSCTSCPTGRICSYTTSEPQICNAGEEPNAEQTACVTCSTGEYSTDGTACVSCPQGHKCPTTGMVNPTECPDGEFQSITGQTSCSTCSAGSSCADKTTETTCSAGTYSSAGSTTCTSDAAELKCQECTIDTITVIIVGVVFGVIILLLVGYSGYTTGSLRRANITQELSRTAPNANKQPTTYVNQVFEDTAMPDNREEDNANPKSVYTSLNDETRAGKSTYEMI